MACMSCRTHMLHVSTMPYLAQGLHNLLAQSPDGITLDKTP